MWSIKRHIRSSQPCIRHLQLIYLQYTEQVNLSDLISTRGLLAVNFEIRISERLANN